jgi:hypothetical protein
MRYVLKTIIYIVVTVIFIFAFAPKKEIILLGEQVLSVYKINIVKQPDDTKIYYDDIFVAKVKILDINLMMYSNVINIKDIKIDKDYEVFVPTNIDNIDITYSLFEPTLVHLTSKGQFGEVNASYNILNASIYMKLAPSKILLKNKNIMNNFVKTKNGYIYEK